jgi:phosphate transport system substrate-binding protein
MAYTRGRCTNLDYCSIAAARRDVEVRVGDDFVCPECGKPLKAPQVSTGSGTNYVLPAIIGGGILVLIGGGIFLGMRMGGAGGPPAPQPRVAAAVPAPAMAPSPAAPAPAATDNVLMRLSGAAQLGRTVAPALAGAYLAQIGDTDIKTEPGAAPNQIRVTGLRGDRREAILIDNGSTATGFRALGDHSAQVVIASRRLSPQERDGLAPLGDMSAATAEHLLGVGAMAVIVNTANGVPGLRRDQISGIFTGAIKDWSALGGSAAPIDVYGMGPNTELGNSFATAALGGSAMATTAHMEPDAHAVASAVAADPRGIGFVDLANVAPDRAVPVADTGATPVSPTDHAAVAHEDYPFTYRAYLYTAPGDAGGIAQHFVEYALSAPGQALVEQQGLVSQTAKPAAQAAVPVTAAGSYKQFVAGAKKIAVTFHFNPNSTDVDLKGSRDVDRVMNYVLSNHFSPDQLILVGFADNQGDPAQNVAVSKKRADAVAAMFVARGMKPGKVGGFGAELEVADNATEDGREKNRRVEVYVKQ